MLSLRWNLSILSARSLCNSSVMIFALTSGRSHETWSHARSNCSPHCMCLVDVCHVREADQVLCAYLSSCVTVACSRRQSWQRQWRGTSLTKTAFLEQLRQLCPFESRSIRIEVLNGRRRKNPSTRRDNAVPRQWRYTTNCGSSVHYIRETS